MGHVACSIQLSTMYPMPRTVKGLWRRLSLRVRAERLIPRHDTSNTTVFDVAARASKALVEVESGRNVGPERADDVDVEVAVPVVLESVLFCE